jgi:hypothetical protein
MLEFNKRVTHGYVKGRRRNVDWYGFGKCVGGFGRLLIALAAYGAQQGDKQGMLQAELSEVAFGF